MTIKKSKISLPVLIANSFLMLMVGCLNSNTEKNYEKSIKTFEEKYGSLIEKLTDTLLEVKELDTNYVLGILPRQKNQQSYYYIDEHNKRGSYFEPANFALSNEQISFFKDVVTDVEYSKKENVFYFKPFYFKVRDKTLLVIVNKSKVHRNLQDIEIFRKTALFTYCIVDAW